MSKTMSFEDAKRQYVHRYTLEHVPQWAQSVNSNNGKYYAPQYKTDKEWYDNTKFPPDPICYKTDCYSTNPTWPLGDWLDSPL